jgi:hypothetical protein
MAEIETRRAGCKRKRKSDLLALFSRSLDHGEGA